jgi:hypothetical protein
MGAIATLDDESEETAKSLRFIPSSFLSHVIYLPFTPPIGDRSIDRSMDSFAVRFTQVKQVIYSFNTFIFFGRGFVHQAAAAVSGSDPDSRTPYST